MPPSQGAAANLPVSVESQSARTDLLQVQPVLWGHLTAQGSKQELQDRRRQAQQRLELRLQKEQQARQDRQKAIDKY